METVMMRKLGFIGVMMVVLLLGRWAEGGVSLVKNGSFEADGAISDITTDAPQHWWDVNSLSGKFKGYVSDVWSSRDGNSVSIYSKALEKYSTGEMGTISQEVYLEEDVNEIIFDLKLSTSSGVWDANNRSAVILIDGVVMWDSNEWLPDSNDEYWNQSVYIGDVSGVGDANLHTLTLALRSNVTETVMPSYVEYRARWDFVKFDLHCGGFGYLAEDFNYDCYVDFGDYAMLANYWLEEVSGLNDVYDLTENDNVVDMNDIGVFVAGWLDNSDWMNWGQSNCYQLGILESDLNGDGTVNMKDYGILAGDWLTVGSCIGADIDCSGIVEWDDVSLMAGEWLMRDWLYGL
jgi:hypothetical protein